MTHTNVERDSKSKYKRPIWRCSRACQIEFQLWQQFVNKIVSCQIQLELKLIGSVCVKDIWYFDLHICPIPARSTDTCLPTRTHSLSNYKPGMPTIFGRNPLTFRCRFPHWPFWAAYKYLNAYRENLIKAYQKLPSQSFKAIMQVLATIFQHRGGKTGKLRESSQVYSPAAVQNFRWVKRGTRFCSVCGQLILSALFSFVICNFIINLWCKGGLGSGT